MAHHSYLVKSAADTTAQGTLRSAILFANANPGTTITFAPKLAHRTITLSHELPLILGNGTVIDGSQAAHLTISGNNQFRVFFVGDTTDTVSATIENLTISHAVAKGGNGGDGGRAGGGGAGLGGAIFVSSHGSLAISGLVLSHDGATGGIGGGVIGPGDGGGGGMGGNGGAGPAGGVLDAGGGGGGFGIGAVGGNVSGAGGSGNSGQFTNGTAGGAAASGSGIGGASGGGGAAAASSGFGGGGGGVGGMKGVSFTGGIGGFGGGGGGGVFAGKGGFGGGGGGDIDFAGRGGFGGGGGGGFDGIGGFGGGSGSTDGGGGGAGMGGAIFVMNGGSLTARGAITINGDSVAAGNGSSGAEGGRAFGGGLFLSGIGTIRFSPGNGQTEHVVNAMDDERGVVANGYVPPDATFAPGSYNLVKSGPGTLILSAHNAYSGGTMLKAGTLVLAATAAAGTGAITFTGHATLRITNAAMPGHVFGTAINSFGNHDILDLSGLHFHAVGAAAIYDNTSHHLLVQSGGVIDRLTLVSPNGTHFAVADDGHGGTKVVLDPPHAATVAAEATHYSEGSAHHLGDYLWIG